MSIAVKRPHDRGNVYKGERLIGDLLSRTSPLSSLETAWPWEEHGGTNGAEKVTERFTLTHRHRDSGPVTHSLHQTHTYSNKNTPPNVQIFQIV